MTSMLQVTGMNTVQVYHFSPVEGLSTLIPQLPSHSEYSDIKGAYLALSIEMCKCWANALAAQSYWEPPFYIYTGLIEISKLYKIVALDPGCEKWELQQITANDIKKEIDQVIAVQAIAVQQIEIYSPQIT